MNAENTAREHTMGVMPVNKLLLSLAMLIGRLEIYPILVLLTPRTWKN